MGRIAVALIVSSWVIPISILVNRIVPEPYMDEIFHIPQAQQYCKGNFASWDPMITTPPGLYYLSLAHVASLFPGMFFIRGVSLFSELCSTPILRSVNGVLAILCSVIVYEIITLLRPNIDERKATIFAVVPALYPLHWFFTFLYYTDVASLTTVLAMYLACLKKKYHLSALSMDFFSNFLIDTEYAISCAMKLLSPSFASMTKNCRLQEPEVDKLIEEQCIKCLEIFIRQTNIVWMLFVACTGVMDITLAHQRESLKVDNLNTTGNKIGHSVPSNRIIVGSNMRRRKPNSAVDNSKSSMTSTLTYSTSHSLGFLDEIKAICLTSWRMKSKLLFSFSPFLVVLVAFVAFVRWNGSVVLGAKEAHAVSPHFAQLMYFSLVSSLALAPLHFSLDQAVHLFRSFWKKRALGFCQWIVALAAGFISVQSYSIAHAYLLADNRHYTFYLWRKVIQSHWSTKYLLVPLYVYSWFSIFRVLAAVLVPAPLIEFRYYTIPFYLMILHSHTVDTQCLVVIGLGYVYLKHIDGVDFELKGRRKASEMANVNPNLRLRGLLLWWRKWGKKDWAIAATGFSIIVFILTYLSRRLPLPLDPAATALTTDNLVGLTLLHNARDRGAHFFNWNKVKIRYCDGASFAGHPQHEFKNGTKLLFRGQLIWEALLDELLSIGLFNAKQALLSGCSAGGLATLIHCDDFRERLPKDATVKCLADAVFCIVVGCVEHSVSFSSSSSLLPYLLFATRDSPKKPTLLYCRKDVLGNYTMRSFYQDVIQLQGVAKSLQKNCITRMDPYKAGFPPFSLCLFPQEIIKETRTPIFLVNPAYDFWQIQHILVPDASDPQGYWKRCRMNLRYCNPSQMEILLGFRSSLIKALSDFQQKKEGGLFINSCFSHCQTWMAETWHSSTSPRINGKTIAESVGDCTTSIIGNKACKTTDVVDDLILIVYGEDNTIFGLHRFTLPRAHAYQDNLIVTPLYPISPSL
ncbi:hypothetical protein DKX38_009364 [Salix brachista]|uniref:Dol-P-Glc:Glc(2)Man(9)GlcNAc(2)-PP-Dol alpha-1,2-glucosyltransferase n=1 Tax=Salix brachista TaxID=2182728 RepID=A0A5N5MCP2_9ROSI|nr:hypothetical protein DKX38_009364 [Salix brachista]